MVESAVDKCQRSLQQTKQQDGLWLRKYAIIAAEVGIETEVAEREAETFDNDMRSRILQTLSDNIKSR